MNVCWFPLHGLKFSMNNLGNTVFHSFFMNVLLWSLELLLIENIHTKVISLTKVILYTLFHEVGPLLTSTETIWQGSHLMSLAYC